jgi:catechol 2,3-dioxygenase-like lactoylglutathione lyase family enzyme
MHLEGIHHITMITGDAPGNVDFYTRVLGLRMVAKTVNQDDPIMSKYRLRPKIIKLLRHCAGTKACAD